jgi:hypothetical protein
MMLWINHYTSLLRVPLSVSSKVCDLPKNAVVESLEEYDGDFMRVRYTASRVFEGWVLIAYAEIVEHVLPHNVVDMGDLQTPNRQDAAQYVLYLNNVQYNLCGEMCICAIFGANLSAFLKDWKAKPLSWYDRVFKGGRSRTTGIAELRDMASFYPGETATINESLKDPHSGKILLSPRRLNFLVTKGWQIIIGVKIETGKGELRFSGVPHWVVVTDVKPTSIDRALVTIYNPFGNQAEQYSWREFTQSVGVPYGLMLRPGVQG